MNERTAFPLWIYFVVAFAIAGAAFVIGQIASGVGMAFAMAMSGIWTAYVVSRQRKLSKSNGR